MEELIMNKNLLTINNITNKMYEYIKDNYPILKLNVSSKDAINYYNRYNDAKA